MKCREKLKIEHPEYVDDRYCGGYKGCPMDYGYLKESPICAIYHTGDKQCAMCWDQEIAEEVEDKKPDKRCGMIDLSITTIDGRILAFKDVTEYAVEPAIDCFCFIKDESLNYFPMRNVIRFNVTNSK